MRNLYQSQYSGRESNLVHSNTQVYNVTASPNVNTFHIHWLNVCKFVNICYEMFCTCAQKCSLLAGKTPFTEKQKHNRITKLSFPKILERW